ncbi:MAG: glycosyltransferase, partial [Chitinispirillia bacterium]
MPSDKPNGVSCQVHYLANALVKIGHSVTCVSFSPCYEKALYRHKLLQYKSRFKWIRKFEPAIEFLRISKKKFDIIHFHGDDYFIWGNKKRIR